MSEYEWDFFVSHASSDRDVVESLVRGLEEPPFNLRCCVSYRDFNSPKLNAALSDWDAMIDYGILQSKQFILVLTGRAVESAIVQREIRLAAGKHKVMRLVRADPSMERIKEAIERTRFSQYLAYPQWLPYLPESSEAAQRKQTLETLAAAAGRDLAELALRAMHSRRQKELADEHENGVVHDQVDFLASGTMLDLIYVPRPDAASPWWRGEAHGFYVSPRPISSAYIASLVPELVPASGFDAYLVPQAVAQAVLQFVEYASRGRLGFLSPSELQWALAPDGIDCGQSNPFGLRYDAATRLAWCREDHGVCAVDAVDGPTNAKVAAIWLRR